MATTAKIERPVSPGPHWKAGDTPMQMGSFTDIKPVFDESRCFSPCRQGCPAATDIQSFISLINEGKHKEALKLVKETNPLPLVCGRVCPAFCELRCSRGAVDERIAINALERFVADYDYTTGAPYTPKVKPATGRKVAIIGGGPAGLSAAYYLALEGHQVTIFEANSQLGGMLRYGIPEYRLPKAVLDKEIAAIANLCKEIKYNASLGKDFTIKDLKDKGYEAIFIGIGAWREEKMGIEGENLSGVLSGVEFLRDIAMGKKVDLGEKVVVVGGGNTAIDTARTALRLLAQEVTILYRRSRAEMPAIIGEVEEAEREGIHIQFLAAPVAIKAKDGKVDSIMCIKMRLGGRDESGRRRPQPIEGSGFTLKVDTVITAIGQTVDTSILPKELIDSGKYIKVNMETMETALGGVFTGGDCVLGPGTVVEAIAAGRRAAFSIKQYLSGKSIEPLMAPHRYDKGQLVNIVIKGSKVKQLPRVKISALSPAERKKNFKEIKSGLTEDKAKKEAERCLECNSCLLCWLFCPEGAISVRGNDKRPTVDRDLCKACGICVNECLGRAIELKTVESAKKGNLRKVSEGK